MRCSLKILEPEELIKSLNSQKKADFLGHWQIQNL